MYKDTKKLQKKIAKKIDEEPHSEYTALREYYKHRLLFKMKYMRYKLDAAISLSKI